MATVEGLQARRNLTTGPALHLSLCNPDPPIVQPLPEADPISRNLGGWRTYLPMTRSMASAMAVSRSWVACW